MADNVQHLILAFDRQDFNQWIHDNNVNPAQAVYAQSAHWLEGRRYPDAVASQTFQFRFRKDKVDILHMVNRMTSKKCLKSDFRVW